MVERALAPVPAMAGHGSVPPQNLEAEESVLGAMMISPGAIDACRQILTDGREFYRDSHARIWRAALALADAGEPVDAITLTDRLEEGGELEEVGGRTRLHELAALVPATANARHYAEIVRRASRMRDLIRLGGMISRLGWEGLGEPDELEEEARTLVAELDQAGSRSPLVLESWAEFEASATEQIPTLVDALWPVGGLGFIAAPPKKGKTWVALSLALAVATGKPFLASFDVEKPEPVVYVALEGHRAAIRGRVGALARGLGLDPTPRTGDLGNFHVIYKPPGLNLNDPAWIRAVRRVIDQVGARMLLVDVLRAAAVMKENSNDEFRELLRAIQPLQETGCAIAMLHHFGKLTEISRDRTPGERMSGAGAMYGAFDVGVFITGSDDHAKKLRIEFETRDLSSPDQLGVHLTGEATGKNGGFVYTDAAAWSVQEAPEQDDVKAPAEEIAEYVRDQGGDVLAKYVRVHFDISEKTLDARLGELWKIHQIEYSGGRGKPSRLVDIRHSEAVQLDLQQFGSDQVPDSRTSPDSRTLPLNHAESPEFGSSGVVTPELTPEPEEVADLQAEGSSGVPTSPTERQPPADAGPPLRDANDVTDDDIDWSLDQ